MKNPKLPPDIEGIREKTAQHLFNLLYDERWETEPEIVKKSWRNEASRLLSKLTEHGYRIEANGYVDFPILASCLKCGSSAGRAGYIVFIPDGTPVKEG